MTWSLPKFVDEDSDMPEPLNTAAKQEHWAKVLAASHVGKNVMRVEAPRIQGFFSRTRIVKMEGGESIVIQFRVTPIEMGCFKDARRVLGDVVPDIEQLHDEVIEGYGLTIYAQTHVPGELWMRIKNQSRPQVAGDLGDILGRGRIANDSVEVVESYIIPTLERFRDSITGTQELLRPHLDRLIKACPVLKSFPLYISHCDMNTANVLILDGAVSGIVDWEGSRPLPFGVGLHRIMDTIVGNNYRGMLEIAPASKESEAAFWSGVLRQAPQIVLGNLEHVQTAVHVGIMVSEITEGTINAPPRSDSTPPHAFLLAALTYRLPQLRGDAEPFAPELISR